MEQHFKGIEDAVLDTITHFVSRGLSDFNSSLEIPVLAVIWVFLIIYYWYLLLSARTRGSNALLGHAHGDSPEQLGTPKVLISLHLSHHLSPLSSLRKAAPLWSMGHTWRCCHGNPSCPSCGRSVCLQHCQHGRRWCPVLTPWTGSWCGSGSTCGCSPGLGRCPAEREILSQPCADISVSPCEQPSAVTHTSSRMKSQVSQAEDWCQLTELMVLDVTGLCWTGNPS